MSSGSQIKGGGRAIMSQESQQALIDLLMGLDSETGGHEDKYRGDVDDNNNTAAAKELSAHDKKRAQKKFMKRLIIRFEQRQLQQRFNSTPINNQNGGEANIGHSRKTAVTTQQTQLPPSTNASGNVRVELVEAIFPKQDKKKKGSSSSSSKKSTATDTTFKVGAKKVTVLPKTTSISEVLKKSKQKLKLKKVPVRAFIQVEESSEKGTVLFDLENDLSALEDGTVLYVSVTPSSATLEKEEVDSSEVREEDAANEDAAKTAIVDPLELVKRAYQRQEQGDRYSKQLSKVNEIIDQNKRLQLKEVRASLPVASCKQNILNAISENEVVVLSGATGSGKSTQVPQFLLEENTGRGRRPYIVVTQPRKVAAISLAYRVAEERGCPMPGVKGSSVGYMVRSDRRVDLRSCRIIYMTIGILLRMLVNQRREANVSKGNVDDADEDENSAPPLSIDSISHLIIDETHERDCNTDFSLTLLKGMISSPSLSTNSIPRLILMSATASSDLFVSYFSTKNVTPIAIEVPGRTFPVECKWMTDCEKFSGQRAMTTPRGDGRNNEKGGRADSDYSRSSSGKAIELSPRATEKIDNHLIRALIVKIIDDQQSEGMLGDSTDGRYRATGAILVFLPGMGEIESLARCLYEKGTSTSNRDICKVMKLHSSIPKAEQHQVFQAALVGTVKVVLATNIAEVRCVAALVVEISISLSKH